MTIWVKAPSSLELSDLYYGTNDTLPADTWIRLTDYNTQAEIEEFAAELGPSLIHYGDSAPASDGDAQPTQPPESSTVREISYLFNDFTRPFVRARSTSYTVLAHIPFPGSDRVGAVESIKIACQADSASGNYTVRIYDRTNSQTVCETTVAEDSDMAIVDLGTISNVPVGLAIWELQAKSSQNNRDIEIASILINVGG